MKNRLLTILSVSFGAAILVGLCYAAVRLVSFLITTLATLNPSVAASLLTGSITIVGSVLAVTLGRYLEKRKEVEAAFRERRLKTYEGFISTFMDLTSGKEQEQDLAAFLRQMNKEMILWAGPKLLKAYITFYRQVILDPRAGKSFFVLEDFYQAIREDLGHANTGLSRGDILSLVLKLDDLSLLLENMKRDPDYTLTKTN